MTCYKPMRCYKHPLMAKNKSIDTTFYISIKDVSLHALCLWPLPCPSLKRKLGLENNTEGWGFNKPSWWWRRSDFTECCWKWFQATRHWNLFKYTTPVYALLELCTDISQRKGHKFCRVKCPIHMQTSFVKRSLQIHANFCAINIVLFPQNPVYRHVALLSPHSIWIWTSN